MARTAIARTALLQIAIAPTARTTIPTATARTIIPTAAARTALPTTLRTVRIKRPTRAEATADNG